MLKMNATNVTKYKEKKHIFVLTIASMFFPYIIFPAYIHMMLILIIAFSLEKIER